MPRLNGLVSRERRQVSLPGSGLARVPGSRALRRAVRRNIFESNAPHGKRRGEVVKVAPELDLVARVERHALPPLEPPLDQDGKLPAPALKVLGVALRGRAVGRGAVKVADENEDAAGEEGRVDLGWACGVVDPGDFSVEAVWADADFEARHGRDPSSKTEFVDQVMLRSPAVVRACSPGWYSPSKRAAEHTGSARCQGEADPSEVPT